MVKGRCSICGDVTTNYDESLGLFLCSDECRAIALLWLGGGIA